MNLENMNFQGTRTGRISCNDVNGHKSNVPKSGELPSKTVVADLAVKSSDSVAETDTSAE